MGNSPGDGGRFQGGWGSRPSSPAGISHVRPLNGTTTLPKMVVGNSDPWSLNYRPGKRGACWGRGLVVSVASLTCLSSVGQKEKVREEGATYPGMFIYMPFPQYPNGKGKGLPRLGSSSRYSLSRFALSPPGTQPSPSPKRNPRPQIKEPLIFRITKYFTLKEGTSKLSVSQ
ncbi:hypothetical protein VUR80DRAFT_3017 [Thermomyces stellatus]